MRNICALDEPFAGGNYSPWQLFYSPTINSISPSNGPGIHQLAALLAQELATLLFQSLYLTKSLLAEDQARMGELTSATEQRAVSQQTPCLEIYFCYVVCPAKGTYKRSADQATIDTA